MSLIEEDWSLREPQHQPDEAALLETLFCLANGTIGVRQALDHEAPDALPGAFHESVYDRSLAVRTTIVNLPTPVPVLPRFADEAIGSAPVFEQAERELSLRSGVLSTRAVIRGSHGRLRLLAQTLVHLQEPDLVLSWGTVTALDAAADVQLVHGFDWRFGNSYMGGHTPQIVTHHVVLGDVGSLPGGGIAVHGSTIGTGATVAAAARLRAEGAQEPRPVEERMRRLEALALKVRPGESVSFVRFCTIAGAAAGEGTLPSCSDRLRRLEASGVQSLLASHERAWAAHWELTDVRVSGDERAQWTLRFGAFHLRQAVDPQREGPAHIPARGLTSEYHSGHSFFNTEFFKLPYWTYTDPSVARRLLLFRHAGLAAARRHAAELDRAGARFPEEVDRDGEPAAPWLIRDLRSDEVAYEWSGREKQFLSAAVAWGVRCYMDATGDLDFLLSHGVDLLVEAARYGHSVLAWDDRLSAFRARSVMGGDEYHYHVDDNHLTNHLLSWSMRYAAQTLEQLAESHPERLQALGGESVLQEAAGWRRVAALTYFPPAAPDGTLQQHEGYFELPDRTISEFDGNGRPVLSPAERTAADLLQPMESRLVKEADVILLLALFPEAFDERTRRASYDFYGPRTVHESSLSAAPYGVLAARLGELDDALRFLALSGRYDLDFLPRGGYRNGLHLAAYAGSWQILVNGFAGFEVRAGRPSLRPRLPEGWSSVSFSLCWRGKRVRVRIEDGAAELWLEGERGEAAQVWLVNDEPRTVTARRGAPAL